MSRIFLPEWAPQSAVMLTWPHEDTDWAFILEEAEAVFCRIALEVTKRQGLIVTCRNEAHEIHVCQRLTDTGVDMTRVVTGLAESNDTWARDHGPLTVLTDAESPLLLDFTFNGWGGKYEADADNAISRQLHQQGIFGNLPLTTLDFVLEGGSIETDGQGTLLTTRQCLMSPTRNPDLNEAAIEALLRRELGVERVLWLNHGHLEGDDTDSHVDTLARLCSPDTIAHVVCDDPEDPHHAPLAAMTAELEAFRTPEGKPYRLIPLPLPAPIRDEEGRRLPATHANFLIINGAVLVPTYGDPTDAVSLTRLAEAFPDREIVGIDCRALIHQFGSLHCVTMQLPATID
ncbi:agmatine deiminase [Ectothiorhodospira shaposhnikovii]|uniref:agmatine deiminase family protein n=1 Tax=Ectothiorhodospira shaposhnikovii TaxID=1054 RepID=UPI001903E62C|nr:agmatine deiminase family protein [Ectothiorhodospira shaposhnikovii]MBK1672226.1 agmatine deiminase [Ectothiorhodospira shaposhnikovii]